MWHVKPSSSRHWQNTWKKWTSSSRAWSLRLLKFSRVSSRILLHSQDTSAADHSNPPKAIKLCSLQLIKDYAPLLLEHRRAYSWTQKCTYLSTNVLLLEHKSGPTWTQKFTCRSETPVSASSCRPSSSLSASSVLSLVSWESKLSQNTGLYFDPSFRNIRSYNIGLPHCDFQHHEVFTITLVPATHHVLARGRVCGTVPGILSLR